VTINSEVTGYDRLNVMNGLRRGDYDLLYVTPELLAQPRFMEFLKEIDIAVWGVDEAHCAASWSHDFRPDYGVLGLLPHHFPKVPRIAVTATADPETLESMKEVLNLRDALVLRSEIDRPNISISIEKRDSAKAQKAKMLEIIRSRPGQSGLVYCVGKATVDRVAAWLADEKVSVLGYHAGMSDADRAANQEAFLRGEVDVLVCTVAFGMGIDKPDVRYVIHNDLTSSVEAYEQEKGRAGRDGLAADAFMFVGNQDVMIRRRMIKKSKGGAASKRTDNNKLDMIVGLSETLHCRRRAIMTYFGLEYGGECGNCDNCGRVAEGADAAPEARDLIGYLKANPGREDTHSLTVIARSVFGAYKHGDDRWSMIVRQMIVNGLVEVRHSDCGRLHATPAGLALREDQEFLVPKTVELTSAKFAKGTRGRALSAAKSATSRLAKTRSPDRDRVHSERATKRATAKGSPLLEALRAMRNQIAREERITRHFVIHDSALQEMAKARPLTGDQLLAIKGVGDSKVARYGHRFIGVIRKHAA
jgi:ATP-dependent DNA helicase RecQ